MTLHVHFKASTIEQALLEQVNKYAEQLFDSNVEVRVFPTVRCGRMLTLVVSGHRTPRYGVSAKVKKRRK